MNIKHYTLILLGLASLLFAQLPYTFTELAHYDPDGLSQQGKAYDVVVSEDSLIFTAFGSVGLYVHRLVDSKLEYITHVRDGVSHLNLLIAQDGSILSATSADGIRVYSFQNDQLVLEAVLDTSIIKTYRMVQGPDNTILMANGSYGLFAYNFDGRYFNYITSVNPGGKALGLTYHSDSTVFLANNYDGIRLYKFNGSEFIAKDHLLLSEDECYDYHAADIAIMNDSTIVSCGSQLNIYNYSNSSFYEIRGYYLPETNWDPYNLYNYSLGERIVCRGDSIYVSVKSEGLYCFPYPSLHLKEAVNYRQLTSHGTFLSEHLIFHANEEMGLSVYDYNFDLIDHCSFSDKSMKLEKGDNNIFFVSTGTGGVKAMRYQNGSFNLLDEAGIGNYVVDVSVSQNGRIVSTINSYKGLEVYEFSDNKFRSIYKKKFTSSPMGAEWTIYYSTEITPEDKLYCGYFYHYIDVIHPEGNGDGSNIQCFDINGTTITIIPDTETLYRETNRIKPKSISADQEGNIFVSFDSKGVKELTHNKARNDGGSSQAVDITENGMIYLANGADGIRSYDFDTSFYAIGHIDDGGFARSVHSIGKNFVLLANGIDGIRSYTHVDSVFSCRAHMSSDNEIYDVIMLSDSTLIVSNDYNGLLALNYDGWSEVSYLDSCTDDDPDEDPDDPHEDPEIPSTFKLYQNYPNPFNPTTKIQYYMLKEADAFITIYDISGKQIKQWFFENSEQGFHSIIWDGKNENNQLVPNGIYICQIAVRYYDLFLDSKKMVLLK